MKMYAYAALAVLAGSQTQAFINMTLRLSDVALSHEYTIGNFVVDLIITFSSQASHIVILT